jgi:Bacterial Ig-like domain
MAFSPAKCLIFVIGLMPSRNRARSRWAALCAALLIGALMLLGASGRPAMAGSVAVDTSPGTAAPPSTLGPYAMTPFAPDGSPVSTSVMSVPAPGGGALQFDRSLNHYTIGNGWNSWSHGYTGDVYSNWFENSPTRDRLVMTLPANTQAFYFYVEPNLWDEANPSGYNVTATAHDGTTSGPTAVYGNAGAKYFGFYSVDGSALNTITVDVDPGALGFAVGEFGIAVDAKHPRVVSTVPAAGAEGVRAIANVKATFSEEMDASSINGTTCKLFKKGTTTKVPAAVSYDQTTDKATLDPTEPLKKGATYKALVTTGAKDLVGNRLDQNGSLSGLQQKKWFFTVTN